MGILFGLILLSLLLAMLVATPLFAYRRAIHLLAREGAGTIAYGPGSGVPAVFAPRAYRSGSVRIPAPRECWRSKSAVPGSDAPAPRDSGD
jgi:hypothetical protein